MKTDILKTWIKPVFYKFAFQRNQHLCKKTLKEYMSFKNRFVGERCFIVANGPSLRIEDLDRIEQEKEKSFGMNRVYVLYDKTDWRPSYYVVQDPHIIRSCHAEINNNTKKSVVFARMPGEPWYDLKHAICFNVDYKNSRKNIQPEFCNGDDQIFADGKTVTYTAIQLAIYMGFKKIYLLGTDCNYSANNTININSYADVRMYDKDKIGMPPDIRYSIAAYESAKQYADVHGIKIYNATRGGKLEVFERVDFDSLFPLKNN